MHEPSTDIYSGITLAILAGGEGRRMRKPKGLLCLSDQPILERLHSRLSWPGPTMLVTSPGKEHPPGYQLFSSEAIDRVPGGGPIQGVLTALSHAPTPIVAIAPVDMPCITADRLQFLCSSLQRAPDAAVAMIVRQSADHRWIEPMPLAISVAAGLKYIREMLALGRSAMKDLAQMPNALLIPAPDSWPEDFWVNLNRPEDVQQHLAGLANGVPDEARNSR